MSLVQRHFPSDAMIPHRAEGAITKYAVVVQGTALGSAKLPAGADPTGGVIGVCVNAAADKDDMTIACDGCIAPVKANAAFAKGVLLAIASAAGDVKLAAPGSGVTTMVVGESLEAAAAGGDIVAMKVRIFPVKG